MKNVIWFVLRLVLAILATIIFIVFTPIYIVSLFICFFYKERTKTISDIINRYFDVWIAIWNFDDNYDF